MRSIKYLPHIDGLRGLAVLIVLLFHFDVPFFSGGYIGVDIFFVISGFLISSIITKQVSENTFSFKTFYKRRIKRLIPTMIFTVALTIVVAYFIFPSYQFERVIKSGSASLLSFSNIFFFLESGYFDSSAGVKPLLHTWSLSVEEQFYLLWPLSLFLILKIKRKITRNVTIIGIGIISLIFSEYFLNINSSVSFFLTPFRIYEFVVGALIIYFQKNKIKNNYLKEFIVFSSLIGLICIVINYNEITTFPGFNAILPCFLSAILIHNTGGTGLVSKVYNNSIIRWFGTLSYSMYLVHWPLVVFYKTLYGSDLSSLDQILLFSITVCLAFIIFSIIENPLRHFKTKRKEQFLFTVIIISIVSILSFNVLNIQKTERGFSLKEIKKGKNQRFKFCHDIKKDRITFSDTITKNRVLIIGDSHAPDALNFLKLAYPEYHYHMETEGGCPPMLFSEIDLIKNHPVDMKLNCEALTKKIFSNNFFSNFDYIVINVMFEWYKPKNLVNVIKEIKKQSDAKIIVFGNYIVFKEDLPQLLTNKTPITMDKVKSIGLYDKELQKNADDGDLYKFISKKDLLCTSDNIKDCIITVDNKPVTYDSDHLSFEIAEKISEILREKKIQIFD